MTDHATRVGGSPTRPDDDGWGPSTAHRSAPPSDARRSTLRNPAARQPTSQRSADAWERAYSPAAPARSPVRQPSAPPRRHPPAGSYPAAAVPVTTSTTRPATRPAREDRAMQRQLAELRARTSDTSDAPSERGWPWWLALALLVVIAAVGGIIDTIGSIQVRGGFNIGIVVAAVSAILVVRRSHMFPIVIAPPIVYSLGAVFQLYLRSGGLHDKKVIYDAAANYLVYGFPAIAAATAAVLIIAGIRLIARR